MTAYNGKTILPFVNNISYEYILTAFSLQIFCQHNTKQIAFNILQHSRELRVSKTNLWHQVLNAESNENANSKASAEYTLCKGIQFIQLIKLSISCFLLVKQHLLERETFVSKTFVLTFLIEMSMCSHQALIFQTQISV